MHQPQTHLLIIDPQNDFCDLPQSYWGHQPNVAVSLKPALPVTGAHADMRRLSSFIRAAQSQITQITTTLDSHQQIDIAHPPFWMKQDGSAVEPFTQITSDQLKQGLYRPRDASALPRATAYVEQLEAQGRYTLMVWPVHCEIGTWGHNVHSDVREAYNEWSLHHGRAVRHVFKGTNPWTEHYSALQAEVIDLDDPSTSLNQALLDDLKQADRLWIAGEASSHCVKATTEHLLEHWPEAERHRVVLLTDCMSPVSGFESQHRAFLNDMSQLGVRLATSLELLSSLQSSY